MAHAGHARPGSTAHPHSTQLGRTLNASLGILSLSGGIFMIFIASYACRSHALTRVKDFGTGGKISSGCMTQSWFARFWSS